MTIPQHPEYIQNETIILNETIFPIIQLELLQGKMSNKSKLNFNWTLVEYKSTELILKIDFENKL